MLSTSLFILSPPFQVVLYHSVKSLFNYQCIEALEEFPDVGSMTPDEWLNLQGYRMLICGKHVAVYRQMNNIVYIYHIADTQTEYTKLFY